MTKFAVTTPGSHSDPKKATGEISRARSSFSNRLLLSHTALKTCDSSLPPFPHSLTSSKVIHTLCHLKENPCLLKELFFAIVSAEGLGALQHLHGTWLRPKEYYWHLETAETIKVTKLVCWTDKYLKAIIFMDRPELPSPFPCKHGKSFAGKIFL